MTYNPIAEREALAAYLASLKVGDSFVYSTGSHTAQRTIARLTKTQIVTEGPYERRFRRDNGLDAEGRQSNYRRDCIITPENAQARKDQRAREIRQHRLGRIMDGLGLTGDQRTKEGVLAALDIARDLAEELL